MPSRRNRLRPLRRDIAVPTFLACNILYFYYYQTSDAPHTISSIYFIYFISLKSNALDFSKSTYFAALLGHLRRYHEHYIEYLLILNLR
jgi:hypothetical protein